jgi:hypothetical protein
MCNIPDQIRQTRDAKKNELDLVFLAISRAYSTSLLNKGKDCPYCGAELKDTLSVCITSLSYKFIHNKNRIVWCVGCEINLETSCCFEKLGMIALPDEIFETERSASKYLVFLKENIGVSVETKEFRQFLEDCFTECE